MPVYAFSLTLNFDRLQFRHYLQKGLQFNLGPGSMEPRSFRRTQLIIKPTAPREDKYPGFLTDFYSAHHCGKVFVSALFVFSPAMRRPVQMGLRCFLDQPVPG